MNSESFVIVEWNQASGRPRLVNDEVYDLLVDALTDVDGYRAETAKIGRRERYTVAEILIDEDLS